MRTFKVIGSVLLVIILTLSSLIGGIFICWRDHTKHPAVNLSNEKEVAEAVNLLWQKTKEYKLTGQVLVAKNGKTIFGEASGGTNFETLTYIGSVSKQFTGAKVSELVDAKKIKLDDRICKYLPDYCAGELGSITIRHLMTHTSGLPIVANGGFWQAMGDFFITRPLEDIVKPAEMEPLKFEPGYKFDYSNLGYELLARVVEVVEKKPMAKVMEEFFGRHGLNKTFLKQPGHVEGLASGMNIRLFGGPRIARAWIPADVTAYENFAGAGAAVSTAKDMSEWLERYLNSGKAAAELNRISKLKGVKDMYQGAYYFAGWVYDTSKKIVWHNGYVFGYQSGIFSYPATGLSAVVLFNSSTFSEDEQKIINAWQSLFLGQKYVLPN